MNILMEKFKIRSAELGMRNKYCAKKRRFTPAPRRCALRLEALGFTLTELIVTVAIVGIVSAAAIANYGAMVARERWDSARDVLRAIYAGEQMYFAKNNQQNYYPPNNTTVGFTGCMVGAGCLGTCNVGAWGSCSDVTCCKDAWRNNVYTDDPNPGSGAVNDVGYRISAGPGKVFTVYAYYGGGGPYQTIDQNGVLCPACPTCAPVGCTWGRP